MSVESIAIALHHSRARGTAKLVLIGIANHDGDGGAWPSIDTLAKYAGVTNRNVQRALVNLVELGEVTVFQNAGGDRNTRDDHRPNLYHFLLTCPPECDRTKNHRTSTALRHLRDGASATPRDHGVALATPRGGASAAHGVAHPPPEPSYEPPMNHLPIVERERSVSNAREKPRFLSTGGSVEPDRRAAPPPPARGRHDEPEVDPMVQAEINRRGRESVRAELERARASKNNISRHQ